MRNDVAIAVEIISQRENLAIALRTGSLDVALDACIRYKTLRGNEQCDEGFVDCPDGHGAGKRRHLCPVAEISDAGHSADSGRQTGPHGASAAVAGRQTRSVWP